MLIGIQGGLGTGKTILLVRYLLKDYQANKKIFANLGLNTIEYSKVNLNELLEYQESNKQLKNVTVGIDEITVYIDCRTSASKRNRLFSYFVLQSRKRNVNMYYTTQDMNMIDFRLTNHTHIIVMCDYLYDKQGKEIENYRKYSIMDFRNRHRPRIHNKIMDIRPYFKYYDTDEIIEPII